MKIPSPNSLRAAGYHAMAVRVTHSITISRLKKKNPKWQS